MQIKNTKNILAGIIVILLITFFVLKPKTVVQKAETEWKKYANRTMGIQFEIPQNLGPFADDKVNFREDDIGPGFINIETEYTKLQTPEEAIRSLPNHIPKIIDEVMIDGTRALVTTDGSSDPDTANYKTIYAVKNHKLYTISIRWVDTARFLGSIHFTDVIEPADSKG